MAGTYGNIRPADVDIKDVEIFYSYTENRFTTPNFIKGDVTQLLEKINHPIDTNRILGGLYNLKLPTTIFNKKGFYNIYIRPKEIKIKISDCGVLSLNPQIKGVIFDLNNVSAEDVFRFQNNGLIGYRIEYLNTNPNISEKKVQNLFRIITSNFKVEPISDNVSTTSQKSIKYRLNETSNLVFCTVTPSTSSIIKPNAFPFIGTPNQEIILSNTFFNPFMVEVEMVENDFDSLAIGIFGNQTKNIKDGTRTYYDENNEIYKQFNEYVIKDEIEGDLYEVKEEKSEIDFSQDFNNIIGQ